MGFDVVPTARYTDVVFARGYEAGTDLPCCQLVHFRVDSVRIGLGQFDAWVGRFDKNIEAIKRLYAQGLENKIDLLVFPELALCGYPPEDLLLKKHFLQDNRDSLERLAAQCREIPIIAGFAQDKNGKCYNSLGLLRDGKVEAVYSKVRLPNYGVFDEERYFEPGRKPLIIKVGDISVAVSICEDIWDVEKLAALLKGAGRKDIILNISASPFHMGKVHQRREILAACAKKLRCPVGYCNMVGGQDELVFDGQSMFVGADGKVACQAAGFAEALLIGEVKRPKGGKAQVTHVSGCKGGPMELVDEVYHALVLGTRDYALKNGFKKVVIGLSGGIDSSVTAAIAVAAMGKENVIGITMPSRFNSQETRNDARQQAKRLGMEFHSIPIGGPLDEFDKAMSAVKGWNKEGTAYENLQARIRGTMLMSLSNKFGWLVLTTGNKSETAVGYSTLYGDTAGGFAVIKDVYKTLVYKLAERINQAAGAEFIPASIISRPPTAELRDNQKDSDSLPPYDVLDEILKGYVEFDKSAPELVEAGFDKATVERVIRLVDVNEYKRRQSPPGVKITPKAFGRDRRLPITNGYTAYKKL
jgi:NAD+ synthase (glutamine-hydrolysing)